MYNRKFFPFDTQFLRRVGQTVIEKQRSMVCDLYSIFREQNTCIFPLRIQKQRSEKTTLFTRKITFNFVTPSSPYMSSLRSDIMSYLCVPHLTLISVPSQGVDGLYLHYTNNVLYDYLCDYMSLPRCQGHSKVPDSLGRSRSYSSQDYYVPHMQSVLRRVYSFSLCPIMVIKESLRLNTLNSVVYLTLSECLYSAQKLTDEHRGSLRLVPRYPLVCLPKKRSCNPSTGYQS